MCKEEHALLKGALSSGCEAFAYVIIKFAYHRKVKVFMVGGEVLAPPNLVAHQLTYGFKLNYDPSKLKTFADLVIPMRAPRIPPSWAVELDKSSILRGKITNALIALTDVGITEKRHMHAVLKLN